MILKSDRLAQQLDEGRDPSAKDPLIIVPTPDLNELRKDGQASVDLRLGTWFSHSRQARMGYLSLTKPADQVEPMTTFVPFGQTYVLHPQSFVLGITLEWICLPKDLAAYVVGKSTWGRYGLIIATATGVHPGYKGCLALELSNVGEVPVEISPGVRICQLFLHRLEYVTNDSSDTSVLGGARRPIFKAIQLDEMARKLSEDPYGENAR